MVADGWFLGRLLSTQPPLCPGPLQLGASNSPTWLSVPFITSLCPEGCSLGLARPGGPEQPRKQIHSPG